MLGDMFLFFRLNAQCATNPLLRMALLNMHQIVLGKLQVNFRENSNLIIYLRNLILISHG